MKKNKTILGNFFQRKKSRAFSIIETLIAMGIASVVITSALGVVGNIYFSQKKIQFTQNFYAEARFMMERIAQIARNNTIDYDRSFIEYGPDDLVCAEFEEEQIPAENLQAGSDPLDDAPTYGNSPENRAKLGYPTIFYWDTNGDGTQDRNLGGMKLDGTKDECAEAWSTDPTNGDEPLSALYLINGNRTIRTAIRKKVTTPIPDSTKDNRVELETQLGADTDGDGLADIWGPVDGNNDGDATDVVTDLDIKIAFDEGGSSKCELTYYDEGLSVEKTISVLGDNTSADFCNKAHLFTPITPRAMEITNLTFQPSPNRDPFLNFRVKEAQIHPHVFISMSLWLYKPKTYGFDNVNSAPRISFQTSVSSRVFGNNRK